MGRLFLGPPCGTSNHVQSKVIDPFHIGGVSVLQRMARKLRRSTSHSFHLRNCFQAAGSNGDWHGELSSTRREMLLTLYPVNGSVHANTSLRLYWRVKRS